jgi:hypothetical protein
MAKEEKSLKVIEQKEVEFYEDELIAVRAADEQIYVVIRQMCNALGIDYRSQFRRIQGDKDLLADGYQRVVIMTTHRGRQKAGALRVDLVPVWLAGIDTSRVKEEIRDKLREYKRNVAKVLWEAFQEGRLTSDQSFGDLLASDSPAAQAYKMAAAIMQMARQQLVLESRINQHEERLERIEATIGDPGRHINPDQASQLSQAVKAVAMALSKKSKRNEYGGVYGELYRKFGITGYKLLPSNRFQEAMDWLTQWHESITGEPPF